MTATAPTRTLIAGDDLRIDFAWRQETADGPAVDLTGFAIVATLYQFGQHFAPGVVTITPLEGHIVAEWSEEQTATMIRTPEGLEARIRVTDPTGYTQTILIVPLLWRR